MSCSIHTSRSLPSHLPFATSHSPLLLPLFLLPLLIPLSYKLLARAYPYMAGRLLTDPAPELRSSFEELIIEDGSLRWGRLENLVREGSKSQFFDPSALWLLGDW